MVSSYSQSVTAYLSDPQKTSESTSIRQPPPSSNITDLNPTPPASSFNFFSFSASFKSLGTSSYSLCSTTDCEQFQESLPATEVYGCPSTSPSCSLRSSAPLSNCLLIFASTSTCDAQFPENFCSNPSLTTRL